MVVTSSSSSIVSTSTTAIPPLVVAVIAFVGAVSIGIAGSLIAIPTATVSGGRFGCGCFGGGYVDGAGVYSDEDL